VEVAHVAEGEVTVAVGRLRLGRVLEVLERHLRRLEPDQPDLARRHAVPFFVADYDLVVRDGLADGAGLAQPRARIDPGPEPLGGGAGLVTAWPPPPARTRPPPDRHR